MRNLNLNDINLEIVENEQVFEVKRILNHTADNNGARWYLTEWAVDNTISWEPEKNFCTAESIIKYFATTANSLYAENYKIRKDIESILNASQRRL